VFWRLAKAVLILPGTALVLIPGLVLWLTHGGRFSASFAPWSSPWFWLGCAALAVGLVLAVTTVRLFITVGQGTPAPWDPPQAFVVRGPYAHVRNPMITGATLIVFAEALLLRSWPVGLWGLAFFLINCLYFPLFEEPALERRFGDAYRHYKRHVPRWIPRLTPYRAESP